MLRRALPTLVLFPLWLHPGIVLAQDDPWSVAAELGASVFFGNTQQSAVTSLITTQRADSLIEVDGGIRFTYGEASNDAGDTFVNRRSLAVNIGADWVPHSTWTPFLFGTAETSLERKLESRLSGGAGVKYAIVRVGERRLDVSLAVLAERTEPRSVEGQPVVTKTLGRWSTRLRYRRQSDDGALRFDAVVWYRPELTNAADYTADLESSLAIALSQTMSFKVSLVDRYDTGARDRGARSNNDGQVLFGLSKTF